MRNLKKIIYQADTRLMELVLSLFTLFFGLPLLFKRDMTQSPTLMLMAQVVPGQIWGVVICSLAFAQLAVLSLDSLTGRKVSVYFGVIIWGTILFLYLYSESINWTVPVFALRWSLYWLLLLRLRSQ